MALNMSDDEDILYAQRRRRDVGRQPFPHSDDEEEEDIDLASDSDGEEEQVQVCTKHMSILSDRRVPQTTQLATESIGHGGLSC